MSDVILTKWFASHKGQCVDVVVAGRVFGGRYGESPQLVRQYELTDMGVIIRFETTEVLTVVNPSMFTLGDHGHLIVPRADEVVFGWHYYGRPQSPENWCEERYCLLRRHASSSPEPAHFFPRRDPSCILE